MTGQTIIFDTRAIANLQRVMRKFAEVAKHSWARILAHESNEWRFELWKAFKKLSPTPSKIYEDAKRRNFAVKRTGNVITRAVNGVSAVADAAADKELAGNKSELFRVEVNSSGVYVKPVRFAMKRIKVLKGGRSGRKFSDSARRSREVEDVATLAEVVKSDPTIKVLNKRALSVAIELGLRSRAAKGGTMALQWLGSNFKRRDSATVKKGPIVIRSSKGIPLGQIEWSGGDTDNAVVAMSGFVPGTAKQATKHGIVGKVIAVRIADRRKFILDRIEEIKHKALQAA
jgi:hypothetical protein